MCVEKQKECMDIKWICTNKSVPSTKEVFWSDIITEKIARQTLYIENLNELRGKKTEVWKNRNGLKLMNPQKESSFVFLIVFLCSALHYLFRKEIAYKASHYTMKTMSFVAVFPPNCCEPSNSGLLTNNSE